MLHVGSVLIEIVSKPWLKPIVSTVAVKTVAVSENGAVTSFVGRSSLCRSVPGPGLGRHWVDHPWCRSVPRPGLGRHWVDHPWCRSVPRPGLGRHC